MPKNDSIAQFEEVIKISNRLMKQNKEAYEKLSGMQAFHSLRVQAQENNVQDLSLEEINEEIRKTRCKMQER